MYAFSPLTWLYSTHAEVFALNNLFICLLVYLMIRYNETASSIPLLLGAFVCGLGLANQQYVYSSTRLIRGNSNFLRNLFETNSVLFFPPIALLLYLKFHLFCG